MATPFVIQQLAKKLRLEAQVSPKLNKFFREISRSITPVLRVTGSVPSLVGFKDDLVEILRKHYVNTAKAFKGDVVTEITKSLPIDIEVKQDTVEAVMDESEALLDDALIGIIALRAPRQADFILRTTEKELNQSLEKITIDAAKEGEALTIAERGRRTARDFNNKIPAKVETIATFETQAMAEDTKLTEAEVLRTTGAVIGGISLALAMNKEWNTILDEKTRDSHVIADGQERNLVRPFNVQGQMLKAPGDTSLGASLSNVINCRCAAYYRLGN
jgi:hypothetical protein